MIHPRASVPTATTAQEFSQDTDHNLLSGLHSLLPETDGKRVGLRLLLDAECHVRLSLSPDNQLLNGSAISNAKLLAIAKFTLLRFLNPAWAPILEDCELQMTKLVDCASETNPGISSTLSNTDEPLATVSCGLIYDSSYAPQRNAFRGTEDMFLPHDSPPLPGTGALEALDEAIQAPYTYGSEVFGKQPTLSCLTSFYDGQLSSSMSTYSSLLPEHHCPPFVSVDDDYLGGSPSSNGCVSPGASSTLSPSDDDLSHIEQLYPVFEMHNMDSQTFGESQHLSPQHAYRNAGLPFEDSTEPVLGLKESSLSPSGSSSMSNIQSTSHSQLSPLHDYPEEQGSEASPSKKKQRRRAFERPPGLPLGPWTPSDPVPFPENIPSKKPRKVRRAPLNAPTSNTPEEHGKISCPDCNVLLLPKSLSRHLERHSNWTKGKYDAHLFCRYCFSAYSRMDSLIHHQKTDAQCVQLQYKIYWKGRQTYLDEAFREWNATIRRVE